MKKGDINMVYVIMGLIIGAILLYILITAVWPFISALFG